MVKFEKITSCKTIDENKIVYDIELEKNHYFAANGIITHNCRLKNKLQTKEFNFTNGNIGINQRFRVLTHLILLSENVMP